MRRLSARPRRLADPDDRVLPLVNIVFLLLIFFILAGRVVASDPFDVRAPGSALGGAEETGPPLVLLSADGRLALDGQETDEAGLMAALAGRAAGRVRLRADGRTAALDAIELIARLRAAGVERIDLVTEAGAPR